MIKPFLDKWLSKPDLVVPVAVTVGFSLFFSWNFAHRTGGLASALTSSSVSSSARSITPRRLFSLSKQLDFEVDTLNHVLITGQSLAAGENGIPALSTTQPYNNLKINGSKVEPLIENLILPGYPEKSESLASGFANSTTFHSKDQKYQIIISNNSLGGAKYEQLKQGTDLYQKNLNEIKIAKNLATSKGLKYRVRGIIAIHGESDNFAGNGADYQNFLQDWYTSYNTDIKKLTGQKDDIYMFTDQLSSFGHDLATPKDQVDPRTSLAQLTASNQNPKIILVGPKYFLDYSKDNLHLDNVSYRKLGEYYAKAFGQTVLQDKPWQPLKPMTTTLDENLIKIKFSVPKQPLVLDITNGLERNNFGFKYTDDSISPAQIRQVKVAQDTVEITLNKIPIGSNKKIQYGLQAIYGPLGGGTGAFKPGAPAGNLRDSDTTPSIYGNNLYNWSVHFEQVLN